MTPARWSSSLAATLLGAAACASSPPSGTPCDPAGNCPGGLVCVKLWCVAPGGSSATGTASSGGSGAVSTGGSGASSTGKSGAAPLALSRLSLLAGQAGGVGAADGSGAVARFSNPNGVVSDHAGTLYLSDTSNNTIRSVDVATAAVTTLAGFSGPAGRGTADGIGSASRFSGPQGLAWDGAGQLYIADTYNELVRQLDVASGAVTTLAGSADTDGSADGTGTSALFLGPLGLAYDGAGALYISDYGNDTIRKLEIATRVVSTVAGSAGAIGTADGVGTAARFAGLWGLALDGAGDLYIVSAGTLRELNLSTAAVVTLNTSYFSAARGLLYGMGELYVTQSDDLTGWATGSSQPTTFAGVASAAGCADGVGSVARFNLPSEMAFDGDGGVFVADSDNDDLRRVALSDDAVTTFAGVAAHPGSSDGAGTAASFASPRGVAADGQGSLYVADSANQTLRQAIVATGAVTTLAGTVGLAGSADGSLSTAAFFNPRGLALDGAGNLYVADSGNHAVRVVSFAGASVATLAGSAGQLGTADGVGSAARFAQPDGVACDGVNLYVTDQSSNTVRIVELASARVGTLAGTPGPYGNADGVGPAARFSAPGGIACDGAGNLFIADENSGLLRQLAISSGTVTTLAGTAGAAASRDGTGTGAEFDQPRGVAYDGASNLYVADFGSGTVRRVTLPGAVVTTVIGSNGSLGVSVGALPAGLNGPSDLAVVPGQALFITDYNENVVLEAD